ncbi:Hexokinase [Apiospora marii]|uniref:Phosphotransferase n=1 Tax=Apiospora marii TaxID=335849 RepID=A0ABR1S3K5_9PEZI
MSPSDAVSSSGLLARAEQIAQEFDFSTQDARKVTAHFVEHMKKALGQPDSLSQIPSYVRAIPTGREKGVFLAVDLGGTNCRICSVDLHGDGTYSLVQTKYPIPRPITVTQSYKPLFRFIAEKIGDFLEEHPEADIRDGDRGAAGLRPRREDFRKLGFTFSFTYEQHSLAKGSVMCWDKGWDIPEALGRDPCEMLQEGLDELDIPVLVVALANDSVGTLLTRAYTASSEGKASARTTTIGAIFGTGTNAAYVEKLENVKRLHDRTDFQTRGPDELMVINTEWGCFGDSQEGLLPSTEYDELLDAASPHPRQEMTEKRISGLYLGELLRLVVLRLVDQNLFSMTLDPESPVFQKDGIESSLLSHIAENDTTDLSKAIAHITETFRAANVSTADARAVQVVAKAIARRAARLAGVALAAIVVQCDQSRESSSRTPSLPSKSDAVRIDHKPVTTKSSSSSSSSSRGCSGGFSAMCRRFGLFIYGVVRSLGLGWLLRPAMAGQKSGTPGVVSPDQSPPPSLPSTTTKDEEDGRVVEVGVDGSLIEFYPNFERDMREAVGDVLGPGHEKRLRIGMAKDGSGVGAALVALAATMQEETPGGVNPNTINSI